MSTSICLLLSSLVTLALGYATGSGQCDLSAQGTINGMSSRARSNGRLTLTLSKSSAAPGERIQVRASVTAASGPIVGVLGTVVDATGSKVGRHVPGPGFAACQSDDSAITHSSSWSPASQISWDFVVPNVAGALAVRVVTLSGASGSAQTFSFKEATLTVARPPASTSSTKAAATTTTTKAAATTTTTKAAATTTSAGASTTSTNGITVTARPTTTPTRSPSTTRPSTRTATTVAKDDVGLASSIVLSSAAAVIACIIALIN
jgi:hypothetical protein